MKKILSILFLFLFIVGCGNSNNTTNYSNSFLAFDTYIQFNAYTKTEEEFNEYYDYAKEEFDEYHQLFDAYNNYKGLNNVKTINDNAGKKAIKVDDELFYLVKQAKEYYKASYQKNNIAIAPVVLEFKAKQDQYDNGKEVTLPKKSILVAKKQCSNIEDIILDEEEQTIFLKHSCNIIDVGSVAKGYTTNLISNKLKEKGLESGILNAGGNVALIGNKPGNEKFNIGITDPDNIEDYSMIVSANDTNIVTSGDYQRFFIVDDQKYHHIIDPDTLMPADINKSVSIISEDGLVADFFSTETFMLPEDKIAKLAQEFDFEYIIIDKNNKTIISDGIKDEVEIK